MAGPKRGQLFQFMMPIRSSSDGSVASTITASDFNSGATVKWYGTNHGGSAASVSGTMSKIASLVRSGVFRLTLNATENNYDQMVLRVNKTGIKEGIAAWGNADYDDSDIMSRLSDVVSDVKSALTIVQSMASDAVSGTQQANSRLLLNQSSISDLQSALSDLASKFISRVPKRVATDSQLSDLASDLRSYMVGVSGMLSDVQSAVTVVQSMASDAASAAQQTNSRVLLNESRVSDVYSLLSDLQSDFQSRVPKRVATDSQLSDAWSDLKSAIGGITVSLDASNISDIASAVVAALPITSLVSDIYSLLSDLNSNFNSRIPLEPAGRSQLSDLASDLRSVATLHTSTLSDIYSLLSDFDSDFGSRVPKRVATDSQLSDLASDLRSLVVGVSGQVSDIASALALVPTVNNSAAISDIYSLLSDMQSDFQSRVPKAVATNSQVSDLMSDLRSFLAVMSGVQSDIYSLLSAGPEIGVSSMSDLRSAITAAGCDAAGADPTGVVGITDSTRKKIDWLTAMSRNAVTQTSTSAVLENDAGTAIASATVSDDNVTFSRGKWH